MIAAHFYQPGEVLPDTVTKILSRSGDSYYTITLCCGHEEEVKHSTLKERVSPYCLAKRLHKDICGRCARGFTMAAFRRRQKEEEQRREREVLAAKAAAERRKREPRPDNAWPRPPSTKLLPTWGAQT